jgi:tRNA(Leu) C34 or U34 (ribose-2'-O)-methylase TrmL
MKNAGTDSIERVQIKKTKRLKKTNEQMERIGKVGTSLTAYTMKWRRGTEEHYRNELFLVFCRKRPRPFTPHFFRFRVCISLTLRVVIPRKF